MVCFGRSSLFLALGLGLEIPWLRVGKTRCPVAWACLFKMPDMPGGQELFSVAQGVGDEKKGLGDSRIFAEARGVED